MEKIIVVAIMTLWIVGTLIISRWANTTGSLMIYMLVSIPIMCAVEIKILRYINN